MSKREILDAEDKAWRALCERFTALEPEDWTRPGASGDWSPKDVMAHIACWHAEAVHQFEAFRSAGRRPWWPDTDEFNRDAYDRCMEMTVREVQAMSGAAHHRFREELAALAEPLPEKFPRWIEGVSDTHYEEHIRMLDDFLGTVGR